MVLVARKTKKINKPLTENIQEGAVTWAVGIEPAFYMYSNPAYFPRGVMLTSFIASRLTLSALGAALRSEGHRSRSKKSSFVDEGQK